MKFIDPQRDPWREASREDAASRPAGDRRPRLLTLDEWQAAREHRSDQGPIGIVLANDIDVELLRADLPRLALVALQFPQWTDGRAYSQARLLRTRLRFAGEVRACGEVLVDMLPLLQRTGFDTVELRADQSLESAQGALRFFAGHYQGDAIDPRPRFAHPAGAAHVRH